MLLRFFFVSKRSKGALDTLSGRAYVQGTGKDIPLGDEEDRLELELTLDGEVLDSEVLLPVVGQALVEGSVLLLGDLLRVTRPDGLRLVELLVLDLLLLDLLRLLGLLLVIDLLDLGLLLALGLLLDFLVVLNLLLEHVVSKLQSFQQVFQPYLLDLLGHSKLNGVRDELRVLLDDILDSLLLKVLELVLLKVEADLSPTTERRVCIVGGNCESSTSGGLPDVLLVIIVL